MIVGNGYIDDITFPSWVYHPAHGKKIIHSMDEWEPGWYDNPDKFNGQTGLSDRFGGVAMPATDPGGNDHAPATRTDGDRLPEPKRRGRKPKRYAGI
jgi:hypothetical protein